MLTIRGSNLPLAPQGLAELQPIIPEGYYYPDFMGMELEYQFALYGEIFRRSPWVNTVITKRANAIARLPVNVWDVNSGDMATKSLDTRSAYARLIADPCPYRSPFEFWFWIMATIDIYGETYLAMQRDGTGKPVALMPMHPSRVAIKRDPKEGVYTYYFQAGSGVNTELVKFPEEDVVPFRLFNTDKLERGMSRMEALRKTIFAEDSSLNSQASMLKNGGRPNVALMSDNRLGTAGRLRLKQAFDDAHAGSKNAGSTLVLEDGLKVTPLQISAVDLELIETRKMNREEIAAVYDIAPTLIGILEHATFSNITEQIRGFYRDTMAPPIAFIQSVMDKYVGSQWGRSNIMRFAVDDVIRGDYEVRVEAAHKGIATGVMTPNEARDLIGLNRFNDPKADELYANSAIQRLGEPAEQIRMQGVVQGATPDGVQIAPPTTPVASLDGSKPTTVSALPAPAAMHAGGGPQPGVQNPSSVPKHLRAVKGELGRGRSQAELRSFAVQLAKKYPEDLDDILRAVAMAVTERNKKKATT